MKARLMVVGVAMLLGSACASEVPEKPGPVLRADTQSERVAHVAERIREEQEAGKRAKAVCGELGLQADSDCRSDVSRAHLGIGPSADLPKYTLKASE